MRVVNGINLTAVMPLLMGKAEQAVRLAGEHVLTVSRAVAPIEEGTLTRSSRVTTETTGTTATAAVSYDTVYAARQHEETTWRHDPGRQAKYLEQPLHAEAPVVTRIIHGQVKL